MTRNHSQTHTYEFERKCIDDGFDCCAAALMGEWLALQFNGPYDISFLQRTQCTHLRKLNYQLRRRLINVKVWLTHWLTDYLLIPNKYLELRVLTSSTEWQIHPFSINRHGYVQYSHQIRLRFRSTATTFSAFFLHSCRFPKHKTNAINANGNRSAWGRVISFSATKDTHSAYLPSIRMAMTAMRKNETEKDIRQRKSFRWQNKLNRLPNQMDLECLTGRFDASAKQI